MTFMKRPLVSILLAYYNDLEHIEDSIKSVYAQTYKNYELIVVDDCSPNKRSQDLISVLQKKYGFKLLKNTHNIGAAKTFQKAFENSKGEYISIISHDDLYTPDKIEYSLKILFENDLDALYCNGAAFYNDNINSLFPFPTEEVIEALKKGQNFVADLICSSDGFGCLLTQGAIYKRRVFTELAWMREKFLLDDFPFTIKVWQDYKTGFDESVLYLYRHHENNVHKNYWRWLPARVQVVSELVPQDKKIETLSYILINMGEFCVQRRLFDDAIRFVTAGLVMSETEKNIKYAKSILYNIKSENKEKKLIELRTKLGSLLFRFTVPFKIFRIIVRSLVFFIPRKQLRRDIRSKLNI